MADPRAVDRPIEFKQDAGCDGKTVGIGAVRLFEQFLNWRLAGSRPIWGGTVTVSNFRRTPVGDEGSR
ncbi:MAG TPA: hypothetical protein PLM53_19765 [Spirochaetota bacterium]|nr:hypothetical protein [Spirochaetota bacterium]HQF10433.1 hypothetical protein [Spirochaetota bacterium]HQH99332.1 hypothetical protein [Spirochaetota bacterium]HQJ73242.1 hypothetical protein [Spirochaetota bacterium]